MTDFSWSAQPEPPADIHAMPEAKATNGFKLGEWQGVELNHVKLMDRTRWFEADGEWVSTHDLKNSIHPDAVAREVQKKPSVTLLAVCELRVAGDRTRLLSLPPTA